LSSFAQQVKSIRATEGQGKYVWFVCSYKNGSVMGFVDNTKVYINCHTEHPFTKVWEKRDIAKIVIQTKTGFIIKIKYDSQNNGNFCNRTLIYGIETDGKIETIIQNDNPPVEWNYKNYTQITW